MVGFDPKEPGVDKVEIESPGNGGKISSTVHLSGVADSNTGITLAKKVLAAALDRISFRYNIGIEDGQRTEYQFAPINSTPNVIEAQAGELMITGSEASFVLGLNPTNLKADLEQPTLLGEEYFALFRSALLSASPVERFMHLYNILLMYFDDERPGAQERLDNFILEQKPAVPMTPNPRTKRPETVYTRLRNEFAHQRRGVNLDETKAEMRKRLGELIELTKRAIQSRP
jgi:hypothetical protein